MRKRTLAIARVGALVATTVLFGAAFGCARVVLVGRRERSGRLADRFVSLWARTARRVIGMRVRIEGEPPSGPVALVCNHLSYVDIIALWCVLPGVFVARADVAGWPLIGPAGRLIGTIFIDRGRKRDLLRVIPEMEAPLAEGRSVIFFPEGTSSRGQGVLPFKSSLFEPAARAGVPVVGVSLQFETPPGEVPADWSVCWWGDMSFSPHAFALLQIDRFEARVRFSSPRHVGKDRKELCRLAEESVQKMFLPSTHDDRCPESVAAPAFDPSSIDWTGGATHVPEGRR